MFKTSNEVRRRFIAGIVLVAACATSIAARGETRVSVQIGWEGMYRIGKWTPVFITAADDKANPARNIRLDITSPHDNSFMMRIIQRFAIGRSETTNLVYVPLGYRLDEVTAVVRDAGSGRFLAERNFDPNFDPSANALNSVAPSSPGEILLGVSGRRKTMDILQGRFDWSEETTQQTDATNPQTPSIRTGFLPPSRLPDIPLGYDGLSALVLNGPDLSQIDAARQQAIAQWVRSGGALLFWPSASPIPPDSPIARLLPCAIGDSTTVELSLEDTRRIGLLPRQEKVPGRQVVPGRGTATIPFLENKAAAIAGRAGLGRVCVLSIDPSTLLFKDEKSAQNLWRPILRDLLLHDPPDKSQQYHYETFSEARRRAAMDYVINTLGDVPGLGTFDFTYIATVLIAMMFIVGPIDWIVLKRLGKQPWTWATVAGWVTLITVGALYIGHVFRSGDLYYRTLRVIDQDGSAVVGAIDVVGIYSPRTETYTIEAPIGSWWEPANVDLRYPYQSSRPPTELAHYQDERGNRPLPMTVNVWNLRFMAGESADAGSHRPLIEAKLSSRRDDRNKEHITGTIRNMSALTLRNVRVQTRRGLASMEGELQPGQTRDIDALVVAGDNSLAAPHEIQSNASYHTWQAYERSSSESALMRAACDLAVQRSGRIEQILRQDGVACVYAAAEGIGANIKMTHEGTAQPLEKHWQIVRALVTLDDE